MPSFHRLQIIFSRTLFKSTLYMNKFWKNMSLYFHRVAKLFDTRSHIKHKNRVVMSKQKFVTSSYLSIHGHHSCQMETDMFIIDFSTLRLYFSSTYKYLCCCVFEAFKKLQISTGDNHTDPISFVVGKTLSYHFISLPAPSTSSSQSRSVSNKT